MTALTVAHMLVSCGKMNELEASLLSDGTLKLFYSFLWPNPGAETLTNWTPRDLLVASEYVEHREDYGKAERGFRFVVYQRGCLPPRYPVPALLVDSVSNLGERWSNWLDTMAEHGKRV